MKHEPVLCQEVIDFLRPSRDNGWIVDATLGLGGHSEALLERYGGIRVLGIDRDPEAIRRAADRLAKFGDRFVAKQGRHESLFDILNSRELEKISGLLADLGVSSMQLDDPQRGFSFRFDAPLDMRMGAAGMTAAELVNEADESDLADILWRWGEEKQSRRIAAAIVRERKAEPIETTGRLAEIVRSAKRQKGREKIDPATLTFQALRIAVNEELVGLESFIESAVQRLEDGARLAMISFHSLEDRIVKHAFRRLEGECSCPRWAPVCVCGAVASVKVLTKRPVMADEAEEERNPRSRSARLRVAEKVPESSD
ncbi:MAG: 16S rRNA (cytosine(1402)-N(4))-methyltransferase RsmH [Thermoanaerobaculia bacterium]|nr:16S rRNA (cytosine(1402)-N(4))-methyltransferase RsmH [Thermoanaerobaculia bacterium]